MSNSSNNVKMVKLGDTFSIKKGRKAVSTSTEEKVGSKRYLQIKDLHGTNDLVYAIDPKGIESKKTDVLIAWDGANAGTVATGLAGYAGSTIAVLAINETEFSSDYVAYFLKSRFPEIRNNYTGATIPHVNGKHLRRLPLPKLPLPEQKRIAEILDGADEARRKRRENLSLYDDLIRSLFLKTFGDPVSNPMGWVVKSFFDVFNITTGKLNSNAAIENGKYPFYTCSKEDFKIDHYAFDCEALILSGNNAAGEYSVKHYNGKFNAYQRTYIITLNGGGDYYFYKQQLASRLSHLKQQSIGTNTKYLTLKIFERLRFIAPPVEVQQTFSEQAKEINAQKSREQVLYEQHDDLFNALLQRAFKGEL